MHLLPCAPQALSVDQEKPAKSNTLLDCREPTIFYIITHSLTSAEKFMPWSRGWNCRLHANWCHVVCTCALLFESWQDLYCKLPHVRIFGFPIMKTQSAWPLPPYLRALKTCKCRVMNITVQVRTRWNYGWPGTQPGNGFFFYVQLSAILSVFLGFYFPHL